MNIFNVHRNTTRLAKADRPHRLLIFFEFHRLAAAQWVDAVYTYWQITEYYSPAAYTVTCSH